MLLQLLPLQTAPREPPPVPQLPPRQTTTTSASKRWYPDHAVYNATKDELKAMPEFKY
jgi:hypothetical protein